MPDMVLKLEEETLKSNLQGKTVNSLDECFQAEVHCILQYWKVHSPPTLFCNLAEFMAFEKYFGMPADPRLCSEILPLPTHL